MSDRHVSGDARPCASCGRWLPLDVDERDCPGCAADREQAERRRELDAARRRLGHAPLTRARDHARWGLVAVVESLRFALEYSTDDLEQAALRRALAHAARAQQEIGLPRSARRGRA